MKQEKSERTLSKTYQIYCSRKEQELKEAGDDLNKLLHVVFDFWIASHRVTSDLSMQMEHIAQFIDIYRKIMSEKEKILCDKFQEEIIDAYENAKLFSEERRRQLMELMNQVFSDWQYAKEFFGGEEAYENMRILWEGEELIDRLEDIIFEDERAGADSIKYVLKKLLV